MKQRKAYHRSQAGGDDNYNSDVLRQIVRKTMKVEECDSLEKKATNRNAARITHHEIRAMKAGDAKSNALAGSLARFSKWLLGFFQPTGLVSVRKNDPCAYIAHQVPRNWQGEFPRCMRCEKEIRTPQELRAPSVEPAVRSR